MFWRQKEPIDLSVPAAKERLRRRMPWLHWREEDRRDFLILLMSEQMLTDRVVELNAKNSLLLQSLIMIMTMCFPKKEPAKDEGAVPRKRARPQKAKA